MSLGSLLFPPKCPFCGGLLAEGETDLCQRCRVSLPYTRGGGRTSGSFFSLCVSPLEYRGLARAALLRYKFAGRSAYAGCFARLLSACIREQLAGKYDLITWVPVSLLRLRKRGFSQSRLLAEAAARQLGVPCRRLLVKRRHTRAQSGLRGAASRRANVSGAFRVRTPAAFAGKRVLVIDDVVTTGATLSECARLLLTAGADRVLCATLCSAQRCAGQV